MIWGVFTPVCNSNSESEDDSYLLWNHYHFNSFLFLLFWRQHLKFFFIIHLTYTVRIMTTKTMHIVYICIENKFTITQLWPLVGRDKFAWDPCYGRRRKLTMFKDRYRTMLRLFPSEYLPVLHWNFFVEKTIHQNY